MEPYSKESPELQKIHVSEIDQRWGQLSTLVKQWSEKAIQYLLVTNAGGAAATLSFLGASEKAFNRAGVKWSLALFVGGLILVGFSIAKIWYHMAGLLEYYKRDAARYYNNEIDWDALYDEDEKRAKVGFLDHFLPWASFALLIAGCIVGGFSLFG